MHDHSLDWAIYLDSDMMIFGDPDQALPENEDVLLTHIISHQDLKVLKIMLVYLMLVILVLKTLIMV